MLGGADNPNGELPSYITGANTGSSRQALNAAAAINTRTQRAKNGRGASLITASRSSKSSYRNS